jgi:hypothetical protein
MPVYCLTIWSFQQHTAHPYVLTYSMEQSPSWEANRFAASQEIPHILLNQKIRYRIHRARHLSLSWASPIQSIPPHPTSWRSILILSSHLRLGHPSGLFPPGFLTKILYMLFSSSIRVTCHAISFFSILSPANYWVRSVDDEVPHYEVFFTPLLPRPSGSHILLILIGT